MYGIKVFQLVRTRSAKRIGDAGIAAFRRAQAISKDDAPPKKSVIRGGRDRLLPRKHRLPFCFFPPFPMKKLLATAATIALAAATASPAFAQGGSSSSTASVTAGTATTADLACMSAAIGARENATIDARATFNAAVSASLTARKNALVSAYAIADNEDRAAAVMAAWNAYFTATADARADLKASTKTANDAFVTASANCHIDADGTIIGHAHHDDGNDDGNHGLHLGWFKHHGKGKAKGHR